MCWRPPSTGAPLGRQGDGSSLPTVLMWTMVEEASRPLLDLVRTPPRSLWGSLVEMRGGRKLSPKYKFDSFCYTHTHTHTPRFLKLVADVFSCLPVWAWRWELGKTPGVPLVEFMSENRQIYTPPYAVMKLRLQLVLERVTQ